MMRATAIALVPFKTVHRIAHGKVTHQPITRHFGDNGRRRNAWNTRIARHHAFVWQVQRLHAVTVNVCKICRMRQPFDSLPHRAIGCLQNIDLVDRLFVH